MENEQEISMDEFMEAFDGDGNQTEDAAEVEETTTEQTEEAETGEADQTEEAETAEEEAEKQDAQPETFTLKVNKEEKTYSREEVISLAQKGADYDRVKGLLETAREEGRQAQQTLDSQKEAMELLEEMAKGSGVTVAAMLENLRIGLLKQQGLSEDAAKERILRLKAEKENAALKAKSGESGTATDRAKEEIAQFRKAYPDVEVTQELVDKLMPEVSGGKSLLSAYREMEAAAQKQAMADKEAKIAELEKQLAAEKKNKENKAASPGSQKDTGGKRTKTDFDEFLTAFD